MNSKWWQIVFFSPILLNTYSGCSKNRTRNRCDVKNFTFTLRVTATKTDMSENGKADPLSLIKQTLEKSRKDSAHVFVVFGASVSILYRYACMTTALPRHFVPYFCSIFCPTFLLPMLQRLNNQPRT